MSYLFSISLCLALIFSILLLSAKDKKGANYLLATFFIFASINIAYILSKYILGLDFYIPFISELNFTIPILYALLLYYYTKATLITNYELKEKVVWMTIGYALYFLSYCYVYHILDPPSIIARGFLYILKPIVTIFVIIQLLRFIIQLGRDGFWTDKNKHFKAWLLWLAIGGFVICFISLTGLAIHEFYPDIEIPHGNFLICAFLSVYFFGLCIITFRSTSAFKGSWAPRPIRHSSGTIESDIQNDEIQIFEDLKSYMASHKPYLDPNLSIAKIAELTNLPASKVSRLINQYSGSTFFDFVNVYRVEKVKSMILDAENDHLSLLGIAMESGFANKSSFNRTFKKHVGQTPSQFRKENSAQGA